MRVTPMFMYQRLANRPDFRALVEDMLQRTGLPDADVQRMLGPNDQPRMEVYHEFAKCFVPKVVDPVYNYELYEFMGDTFVNSATISYLGRALFERFTQDLGQARNAERAQHAVGYLDKLKSVCVSTPFLADISAQIGFTPYLLWVFEQSGASFDMKKEKNYQEDVVEAFFGCMVRRIDLMIEMGRGYYFCSNMLTDLLNKVHINYDPRNMWTAPILLKETNDLITAATKTGVRLDTFEIRQDRGGGFSVFAGSRPFLGPKSGIDKDVKNALAAETLGLLSRDQRYQQYKQYVKQPPSPEVLNITDLLRR